MGGAAANGIQAQAPPAPADRQQSQQPGAAPVEREGEAGLAAENERLHSELSQVWLFRSSCVCGSGPEMS